MTTLYFYISENLRKNINDTQIKIISETCQKCMYVFKNDESNNKIAQNIISEPCYFALGDAVDFEEFIKFTNFNVTANFIIFPNHSDLPILEKFKDEMKNIRYLIGSIHNDLLGSIIEHILIFKKNGTFNNFFKQFQKDNFSTLNLTIVDSTERPNIQTKVTEFFQAQIDIHKDKFVAGSSSYAKLFGDIVDEFLMNAIWDASPNRNTIDRTKPITLQPEEYIDLLCMVDNINLFLTVSDKFGSFKSEGITKYIRFGLGFRETQNIKNETAGAGLGIFMILQKISILIFEVEKGKITTATALARGDQSIRDAQKKPKTVLFFER